MFVKRSALCAVRVALALAVLGTARSACALPPVGCEPAERFRLANGVEVVLEADHSLPAVAVWSSVHVGQRNDPPGHEDLAHYVEHLTIRSAPPFTPADELYAQLGAVGMNATTSDDTTDYFAVVPSTHLENALWIESRRLAMGLDTVTSAAALQERSTMQREYDLRFALGRGRHPWVGIMKSFFPKGHPYMTGFSSEKSISGLTLEDARWFFGRYYRPERVRIVLVGDFDPTRARQLIEGSFGTLRARDARPPTGSPAPFDATPEAACSWAQRRLERLHSRVIVRTRNRTERLILVWMHPSTEDAERWLSSLETFADTVQDAMHQAGIASRVGADIGRLELGVVSMLGVEVTRGRQLNEAESLLRKLFAENVRHDQNADTAALRQAAKTSDLLRPNTLLSRAKKLAIRLCQPAQCTGASSAAGNVADLSHFPLERALIIEERYARYGDIEGDLEVVQ